MTLSILAVGSLRRVWQPLMVQFELETGLLRAHIEAGEPCALFASANMMPPPMLRDPAKAQAVPLFAGNTLCLTAGAQWIIASGQADLMIGYRSYAEALKSHRTWRVFEIPFGDNIQAAYGLARCDDRAEPLCGFLVSDVARQIPRSYGFVP